MVNFFKYTISSFKYSVFPDQLMFTCWICLLRFSVLFTDESLLLLYLLFISWFISSRRWCIDNLGVFIYVSWSTSELRVRLAPWNWFKPSSKIFLLTFPRWYFFCGSFMFFSDLFLLCLCARLFICALWSPTEKGLTSWLLFVVSNYESLSNWYPGSGVVLDCIDSWSLHPYLLLMK